VGLEGKCTVLLLPLAEKNNIWPFFLQTKAKATAALTRKRTTTTEKNAIKMMFDWLANKMQKINKN
jgi:hypothetical protein